MESLICIICPVNINNNKAGQIRMDHKEQYSFYKFMEIETRKIDQDKWIEGQKLHKDPGQDFIIDWIMRNAANWRNEWDQSKCKDCVNWKMCGHLVLQECSAFSLDKEIL